MFPEMRRQDRRLSQPEARELLERVEYGVLSTVGVNEYPYGIPVNYVLDGQTIYFHCAMDAGAKVENIRHNPKVCFTVVGGCEVLPAQFATKYESAIAFGTAEEILGDAKQLALEKIIQRFSNDYIESGAKYIRAMFDKTAVFAIHIDHLTGKSRK